MLLTTKRPPGAPRRTHTRAPARPGALATTTAARNLNVTGSVHALSLHAACTAAPTTAAQDLNVTDSRSCPERWHTACMAPTTSTATAQDLNMTDSYTMSEWLLGQVHGNASRQPPQYAALMWADPIVLRAPVEFASAAEQALGRVEQLYRQRGVETERLGQYFNLLSSVPGEQIAVLLACCPVRRWPLVHSACCCAGRGQAGMLWPAVV